MFRVEQYMSGYEARNLLSKLREVDDAWYVDREKHFNNMTYEGRPSRYDCLLEDTMPPEIKELIDEIRPDDTDELIINRYKKGMHIGRHHDGCVSPFVSVITLENCHNVVRVFPDNSANYRPVPDRAGQMYTIGCSVDHEVLPVQSERFSIVILRGMMRNDY